MTDYFTVYAQELTRFVMQQVLKSWNTIGKLRIRTIFDVTLIVKNGSKKCRSYSVIRYVCGSWADCYWMKPYSVYVSYGNSIYKQSCFTFSH